MTIRIGANPIGWSNDDLQGIGGDTPLETCLAEAKEAGFVGMEKGHKMPNEGALLKAKLAAFGHVFVAGWYSTELLKRSAKDEFEAAKAHIAMTKGAGSSILIAAETSNAIHGARAIGLSQRPRLHGRRVGGLRRQDDRVRRPRRRSRAEALLPSSHGHRSSSPSATSTLSWRTEAPRALLLDTGHARWGGSDPAALARVYRERIGHVHCKDVREAMMRKSNAGDWSFLDSILGKGAELGVYTVPGDGCSTSRPCSASCSGYSGWVVMEAEQDPKKAPPLPYAKKGVAHLRAALQRERPRLKQEPRMSMSKLLVKPNLAAPDGVRVRVTPESAGWRYVGFEMRALGKGARFARRPAVLKSVSSFFPARRASRPAISTAARSASAPTCSPACRGRSTSRPIAS